MSLWFRDEEPFWASFITSLIRLTYEWRICRSELLSDKKKFTKINWLKSSFQAKIQIEHNFLAYGKKKCCFDLERNYFGQASLHHCLDMDEVKSICMSKLLSYNKEQKFMIDWKLFFKKITDLKTKKKFR